MLPYYDVFDNLQFRVEGSTVILTGQVTRPTLKSSAETVVERLEGIGSVENQIEVLPVSPRDDSIRLAVYRAIYYNSSFTRYAIRAVPPSADCSQVNVILRFHHQIILQGKHA